MAGKRWDEAALPQGALGYSNPYGSNPDDLYARFADGTFQLLEKGHGSRMMAEAIAANKIADVENAKRATVNQTIAPTTSATPATPTNVGVSTKTATASSSIFSPVKTATKDIILFDDGLVPVNLMADLIFEDIGGEELLSIARTDTVNGQKITYQPIKNLSSIEQEYNPNNIVSLQATLDKYFANFPIKLDNKIPETGTGSSGDYIYIDSTTGDLTVEAVNLEPDEQIEIQIATNGTIYETDFNGGVS
jgi:hypothetical protein